MRHAKKVAGIGWRGLLALVGGVASLAGCGGVVETPPYGVPLYGAQLSCSSDSDCATKVGNGWYCDQKTCAYRPDAGTH
jgi:hypothetical protein